VLFFFPPVDREGVATERLVAPLLPPVLFFVLVARELLVDRPALPEDPPRDDFEDDFELDAFFELLRLFERPPLFEFRPPRAAAAVSPAAPRLPPDARRIAIASSDAPTSTPAAPPMTFSLLFRAYSRASES
jgi:hypothetical protein